MVLNSAVNSFREPGSKILGMFMEYQELWEGDRDQLVNEFINPPADADPPREAPSLSELKAEIQRYVDKLDEIAEIENSFIIGNLQINSANIKTALTVEAKVKPKLPRNARTLSLCFKCALAPPKINFILFFRNGNVCWPVT